MATAVEVADKHLLLGDVVEVLLKTLLVFLPPIAEDLDTRPPPPPPPLRDFLPLLAFLPPRLLFKQEEGMNTQLSK